MKPETKDAIRNMASLADLVKEARESASPGMQVGRPEGSITIAEYAHETGVSISAAQRTLNGLVADGKYTMQLAVAPSTYSGKIVRQQFYRKVKR